MGKIAGIARTLGIILALVAAFVNIPSINVALVLVIFGIIAGLCYDEETVTRLILTVLVLPAVGTALGHIPGVGSQLATFTGNLALAIGGAAATVIAIRLSSLIKGDVIGITK